MEVHEGRVVVKGRAAIDTRAPFRSVKEAVQLFGEKVLAGEVYANKLKEFGARASEERRVVSRSGAATAELEEMKLSLEAAREEAKSMANHLNYLREELHRTREELQQLKARQEGRARPTINPEIEEFKFVENSIVRVDEVGSDNQIQKKKIVRFASSLGTCSPGIDCLHSPSRITNEEGRKKQPLRISPAIGWLFPMKKRSAGGGSRRS
ncbi:hypothetical protein Nepgr_008381 [Nepenthes gracilis]|uniref:WEB family protein n=1 Tax=Nepenthes gracilis TaxID=150966 RepID=A0AAD3XJD9_NEPGR|nr:hypothetical protein Nepgr_008381 [Nepenthes gracilis]